MTTAAIPTIDLAGDADTVAAAIDAAASQVGFFQIVGHGLDPAIADGAWDAARQFFDLPLAAKLAVRIAKGDAYGYAPFRAERLAASRTDVNGAETPPDLKETFSVGPFDPPAPGVIDADPAAAFVYSPNRWPADLPELPGAWEAYYRAMAALVERVLALMARGLGLAPDFFAPFVDRHTSALRALRYPDLGGTPPAPGQLRAGAHSDYGTLTLLRQDDAPGGLEVRGADGAWHRVPAVAGAFVVNVGDALERWSNDRWRSTLHRVVVPPTGVGRDCTRQSMAFFHNANWDALIEPIGPDPRYPPVTAGRHLMDKFRATQS